MFKKILVPITPETLPLKAIKRASKICHDFGSKAILLYILDPKLLELMDQASGYALSPYDRERVREDVTKKQAERAREITLNKTLRYFKDCKKKPKRVIKEGEFSDVILKVAKKQKVDMVFLEYQPDTLLRYRILHMPLMPTWLDRGKSLDRILVLTTNLAPNRKGPMYAADLANMYGSKVEFCYIIDPTKKKEASQFLMEGKKQIKAFRTENPYVKVESVIREGPIEDLLPTLVKQYKPGLVIMGRFKKVKKRFMGLLVEDVKTKLVKTLNTNILVVK